MQLQDVEKLIQSGECETVEFKKSTGQCTTADRTLCAMLKTGQGVWFFLT